MKELEAERLVIRNFRPSDYIDLHEYLSREDVLEFEPGTVSSLEDCAGLARERSAGNEFLAVCLRDTGKMIGHVYFARLEPVDFMTWEIGYIFNPAYYGKGYATEACRRVLEYAFSELGAHRVTAMCNPENVRSWKLLERLSMRREGHFLKHGFFRRKPDGTPVWHDAYAYAILAEEWKKNP